MVTSEFTSLNIYIKPVKVKHGSFRPVKDYNLGKWEIVLTPVKHKLMYGWGYPLTP